MGCLVGKLEPARTGRLGGEYQRRSGVGGGERASLEPKPTSCTLSCPPSPPVPKSRHFSMEQAAGTALQGAEGLSREGGHSKNSSRPPRVRSGEGQGTVQRRRKGNFFRGNKNRGRVFRQQGAGHRPMGEGNRTEGGWGRGEFGTLGHGYSYRTLSRVRPKGLLQVDWVLWRGLFFCFVFCLCMCVCLILFFC